MSPVFQNMLATYQIRTRCSAGLELGCVDKLEQSVRCCKDDMLVKFFIVI